MTYNIICNSCGAPSTLSSCTLSSSFPYAPPAGWVQVDTSNPPEGDPNRRLRFCPSCVLKGTTPGSRGRFTMGPCRGCESCTKWGGLVCVDCKATYQTCPDHGDYNCPNCGGKVAPARRSQDG